jgi:branched-chain amino acid transport system substrate-binding protein
MRLATFRAIAGGLLLLSAAVLSACGGSAGAGSSTEAGASLAGGGKVVDIYSSLPARGPSAAQTAALVKGIKLALAQAGGRAGPFTVRYIPLDDSGGPGGWGASQTAANAHRAAADPRTVYYIGEFDDDASKVSMPILNVAGIPQVSPANTYVGLTTGDPGSAPGEPTSYAPTGTRTYLRIVPIDAVQGAAILLAMKQAGCARSAVVDDEQPYGAGLATLIELEKGFYAVNVLSATGIRVNASALRSYESRLRVERPDCFVLAGTASPSAVQLTMVVHAASPTAKIFAPGAMCTGAWTSPQDGGVPATVARLIECTEVTRNLGAYPGGRAFLAAYKANYRGADPAPYAILGYEAMKLGLSTIVHLGDTGDSKSAVLNELFSTTQRRSVIGTYGFDKDGDTTLRSFGLYKLGSGGDPRFVRTITPPHVL